MVRRQALPPVAGGVRVSPIGDRPSGMEVRRAIESQADKLQLSAAIDEAMAWLVAEEITSLADLSALLPGPGVQHRGSTVARDIW